MLNKIQVSERKRKQIGRQIFNRYVKQVMKKSKEKNKMKNVIKKLFAVILITLIVSCSLIPALAVVLSDINAKTKRIESLVRIDNACNKTQGLTVTASGSNKRLFVVRINKLENKAILYMYKNYTKMSTEGTNEYRAFELLDFAKHANGMAIDDDNIYITCSSGNNVRVARIERAVLWDMYNSTNNDQLTADSGGVTIMPVVNSDRTPYNKKIIGITYYEDGKFIVMTEPTGNYLNFATAYISDDDNDGKNDDNDVLVVSNDATKTFKVYFDDTNSTFNQDIGYDSDCGLFIVRAYKTQTIDENGNEVDVATTNNSIIWINLNSLPIENNRVYTKTNSEYRIIKVNKSSDIFKIYELESVSIGSDNYMYASVNVHVWDSNTYSQYMLDPIIRIKRPDEANGSDQFLVSNINA